jgi:hypothetical protein
MRTKKARLYKRGSRYYIEWWEGKRRVQRSLGHRVKTMPQAQEARRQKEEELSQKKTRGQAQPQDSFYTIKPPSILASIVPRWMKLTTTTKRKVIGGTEVIITKMGAVDYVSMNKDRLKALAQDPESPVDGYPDPDSGRGDWIFDRESLDEYRMQQSGRDVILAVLNSFDE